MSFNTKESAQDYKRLLIEFAYNTGQLDQLHDYIDDTALQSEFQAINFDLLKFELN